MNFDVHSRVIYLAKHGSHAYGLSTPQSDLDIKGICIEPKEYYFGYLHTFEQLEAMVSKGHPDDKVIYSLKKFMKLAAECNPSIIEVLHCDESDILKMDEFGEWLRDIKDAFLSRRAKHTFSGFANSQLKRIRSHRAWLLTPPVAPPNRKDFNLSETTKVSRSELGAYNQLEIDGVDVEAAFPKSVTEILVNEKRYMAAKTTWDQYQNWKKTRNPARSALEEKYGYDTKHGSHLIRLMRMCKEILSGQGVIVKRHHDREFLLGVKTGAVEYDDLIEQAEKLDQECEALYLTSSLPKEPDHVFLHNQCVKMIEEYIRDFG